LIIYDKPPRVRDTREQTILAAVSAHRLEYLRKRDGRLHFLPLRRAARRGAVTFFTFFCAMSTATFPKRNSIRRKLISLNINPKNAAITSKRDANFFNIHQ